MTRQALTPESDAANAQSDVRPIRPNESDVPRRLREVIGDEPQAAFARRCGIGETTLRKYLDGADPSTSRLVAIADTTNISVEWLATGRGEKARNARSQADPVQFDDMDRLARTIAACEEGLRAIHRTLPPEKYGELVAAAYRLMGGSSTSTAGVVQFIKAAA